MGTQFIMNDHGDTIQYLDEKFGVTGNSENNPSDGDPVRRRISRARESSFSLDSDVDAENANGRAADDAEAVVSSSSSDDEGSSSDSGSSSDEESDEEEGEGNNADVTADEARLEHGDNNPAGDTGYESQREEEETEAEECDVPDVTSSTASL